MKLNIYEKKKIKKTYEADKYDLLFGTLEDVANAVNLDEMKTGTDTELLKLIGGLVFRSMGTVKELLKDIFEGITDEDLKNTKVSEIAAVLLEIVKYTIEQLSKNFSGKN